MRRRTTSRYRVSNPGHLRLDTTTAQVVALLEDPALLVGDTIDDVDRHRDAVRVAEDLDPSSPVRRLRVTEPALALIVRTERSRVLQGVCDIPERRRRPSMIKVEQADQISPRQTPFQGPKSPWQMMSPDSGVWPARAEWRPPGGGRCPRRGDIAAERKPRHEGPFRERSWPTHRGRTRRRSSEGARCHPPRPPGGTSESPLPVDGAEGHARLETRTPLADEPSCRPVGHANPRARLYRTIDHIRAPAETSHRGETRPASCGALASGIVGRGAMARMLAASLVRGYRRDRLGRGPPRGTSETIRNTRNEHGPPRL